MIEYTFVFLVSILFAFLSDFVSNNKFKNTDVKLNYNKYIYSICLLLSGLTLVILSAMRSRVGSDYNLYLNEFNALKYNLGTYVHTDFGFQIFNILCSKINPSPVFFFAACSAIYIYGTYYLINRLSVSNGFSVTLFILLNYYLSSYSLIAQCCAIGFICISVSQLLENKLFRSLILIIVASFFHSSAFVFLLIWVYFVVTRKANLSSFIKLSIIISLLLIPTFLVIVPNILKYTRFYVYLFRNDDGLNSLSSLIFSLIALLLFIISFINNKNNNNNYIFKLSLLLLLISIDLCILQYYINLLVRLSIYFTIFQIIIIPYALRNFPNKNIGVLISLIITIICLVWFYLLPLRSNYYNILPYYSIIEKPII